MDGITPIPSSQQNRNSDPDPGETREWLKSLSALIAASGPERGQFLVHQLADSLHQIGASDPTQQFSAYRNTISLGRQGAYPGEGRVAGATTGSRVSHHQPDQRRSIPEDLLNLNRKHWGIEIMHRNKDVMLGEDGYTNRFDNAPRNVFSLTGLALKVLRCVSPSPTRAIEHFQDNRSRATQMIVAV